MNGAQFHLALNHLPVVIPMIALPIVLLGLAYKSMLLRQVGLWLLVVSGLTAIPTYLTGNPARKVVMNYPGVSRMAIEQHETSAKLTLIAIEVVAAVSALLLLGLKLDKRIPLLAWPLLVVFGLASFLLAMRTAHLGGEIRHEEIQSTDFLR